LSLNERKHQSRNDENILLNNEFRRPESEFAPGDFFIGDAMPSVHGGKVETDES
jgi:hypothetical protein